MSHSPSPQKRRFDCISGSPASLSQRKRQHIDFPTFSAAPDSLLTDLSPNTFSLSPNPAHSLSLLEQLYSSNSESYYAPAETDDFQLPTSPALSPEFSDLFLDQFPDLSSSLSGQYESSFDPISTESNIIDSVPMLPWTEAEIEAHLSTETHNSRLSIQDEIASGKDTAAVYKRQVDEYRVFMAWDQAARVKVDPRWVEQSWEPVNAAKVAVYLQYVKNRPKVTCDYLFDYSFI